MKKLFYTLIILSACSFVYAKIEPGINLLDSPIKSSDFNGPGHFEIMLSRLRDRTLVYNLLVAEATALTLLTVSICLKGTKSKATTALFIINIFILVLLALPNLLDII